MSLTGPGSVKTRHQEPPPAPQKNEGISPRGQTRPILRYPWSRLSLVLRCTVGVSKGSLSAAELRGRRRRDSLRKRTPPCSVQRAAHEPAARGQPSAGHSEQRALSHGAACYGAGMAIIADQRRALEMLAGSLHGFGIGTLRTQPVRQWSGGSPQEPGKGTQRVPVTPSSSAPRGAASPWRYASV
jgi:hypothetical protein